METRICPSCKKHYYQNETICPKCHTVLADIDPEFEIVLSAIPEPVVLADGNQVESGYLMDTLEKRRISYYIEKGTQLDYSNSGKRVEPISCDLFYIDKSRYSEALEALEEAKLEQQIDDAMPTVFLDFPEEEENDWESEDFSDESYEAPLHQDVILKQVLPGIGLFFIILLLWLIIGDIIPT